MAGSHTIDIPDWIDYDADTGMSMTFPFGISVDLSSHPPRVHVSSDACSALTSTTDPDTILEVAGALVSAALAAKS